MCRWENVGNLLSVKFTLICSRHVEVNSLQYYILSPVESIDDPNLITPVITRAYFPYFCKTPPLLNSTWSIVVEVEEDLKTDFPCFTKEDGVKVGDVSNVSAVPLNNELGNWTVTVSQLEDLFISVQTEPQDLPYYGGAYFKKLDDRWNSIGYAYEVPVDKLTRMSVYVDTLCDWAGICEPPISTTKTPIPNKSKKNEEKNGKGADNGKTQNGYEIIFLLILIPLFF
uniref:DUF3074 domain-containing protein n=1 Tax=Caenorhabditis tropicalis TaxID=1561998 RepID=A0A1I7TIM7_9PELO